jgi:hypothetical protein
MTFLRSPTDDVTSTSEVGAEGEAEPPLMTTQQTPDTNINTSVTTIGDETGTPILAQNDEPHGDNSDQVTATRKAPPPQNTIPL